MIMRILTVLVLTLSSGACRKNDFVAGPDTVNREYSRPASEVYKVALQSAESAGFTLRTETRDRLGGDFVATRDDGKEVRILVRSLDEKSSLVSVRVEAGDRDLAEGMQDRISGNLGIGNARTGWWIFGGDSIEAMYDSDLASCMDSARRTAAALAWNGKEEELHATWGQIDGRWRDSTPVRIKMERAEDGRTRVSFLVGNARSHDNRAFAQRMKFEFDSIALVAGGRE